MTDEERWNDCVRLGNQLAYLIGKRKVEELIREYISPMSLGAMQEKLCKTLRQISGVWHPVVQDECRKINEEVGGTGP